MPSSPGHGTSRVAAAIASTVFLAAACATAPGVETGSLAPPSLAAPQTVAPTETVTPTTPVAPSATASDAAVPLRDGPLPAGTYATMHKVRDCAKDFSSSAQCRDSPVHEPMRITFAIPDGWAGIGNEAIWLAADRAEAPDGASLLFDTGAWLLSDPCQNGKDADIRVGPGVADFANALADHPLLEVTKPVDVTLAGYAGKYLDLQVPADISMCDAYRPWDPGLYAQGPGHRWHLWVLDVEGARVVVQSTDYAGTSAQHRAELQAIVDSIRIEPTPPTVMPVGDLEAGTTYSIAGEGGGQLIFTVPADGWFSIDNWFLGKNDIPDPSDGYDMTLLPYQVANVYPDPCHWHGKPLDPPVGPTVADLAAALVAPDGRGAPAPKDVTVGGYAGTKVELSIPDDVVTERCDEGDYGRWSPTADPSHYGPYTYGHGQHDTVYILDVEGTRSVIDANYLPGTSKEDLAELKKLVASIRFAP